MLHNLITAIRSNSLYLFYLANRTIKVNCSNYYSHRAKFSENKSVLSWHSIIVTFTSDDLLQYSSLKSSYNFQDIHVSKGVEILYTTFTALNVTLQHQHLKTNMHASHTFPQS